MDQGQEDHLARIQSEFRQLVNDKYRKGAEEHKTNLYDTPPMVMLDFAIDEAIDQVTYLLTLREQMMRTTLHEILK